MSDDADNKMALSPGTILNGKYRVESVLGHGGFGITYYARDTSISREVAIKECLPADFAWREGTTVLPKATQYREDFEWARKRFMDEARTLAQFDHPAILKVYDIFEANDTSYMVTRYEPGWTLPDYLEAMGRTLSEEEIRVFLHSLLEGLEQVHEAGYLHRDIKPENIYITERGQSLLLDFGSARQAVSNRSRPMTSVVTPGYAPFEQYHEDGNQGPWSDLYALAACIHYMLRGKPPPEATLRERSDPYEAMAQDNKLLPYYDRNFLTVIDQALSPKEQMRPKSAQAFRRGLVSHQYTNKPPKDSGNNSFDESVKQSPKEVDKSQKSANSEYEPVTNNNSKEKKIGGWLITHFIYMMFFTTLRWLFVTLSFYALFSTGLDLGWDEIFNFNDFFTMLILFEIIGGFLLVIFAIYNLKILTQKKFKVIKFMIFFHSFSIVFVIIHLSWINLMITETLDVIIFFCFSIYILINVIWIFYYTKSKRVKETFIVS